MSGPYGPGGTDDQWSRNQGESDKDAPESQQPGQQPWGQYPPQQPYGQQYPQGQYPQNQTPQNPYPQGQYPQGAQQGQYPGGAQQGQYGQYPQGQYPTAQPYGQQYPQGGNAQGQYGAQPGQYGQQPYGQTPPQGGQFPQSYPQGQPQGQPQWNAGQQGSQGPQPGSSKTALLVIGGLVAAIVVIGAVLFLTLGGSKTLDRAAAESGVEEIVTGTYGSSGVTDVSCPDGQEVKRGNSFDCSLNVDGISRTVTLTFADDDGTYEVSRPR